MYVPPYAQVQDEGFLLDFIEAHPFALLINQKSGEIEANHFPILLERKDNGAAVLWTHMARQNPQWESLHEQNCLIVFQGPEAYISPQYYVNKVNVPTWSYTSVQVKAQAQIFEDAPTIKDLLKKSVDFFERDFAKPWDYSLPDDFHEKLVKAIVGVKLTIQSIQGKFKLSQNRNDQDYKSVQRALGQRTDDKGQQLLRYMKLTREN